MEDRLIVARYIASCVDRDKYSLEKIVNLVVVNQQEKEKLMRSVAQEYIDQGKQQGMQQGIHQEKIEIAKIMLNDGEPIDKIIKWTGLTKSAIEQLKNS